MLCTRSFPGGSVVKNLPANTGDAGSIPSSGRVPGCPGQRKWHSPPVFLPRKSHGQRSLRGYNPWGCKQSDTAERLILSLCYWGTSKKMANHTPSNVTKGSKHDPNPSDKEKKFLCNNRPRRSNCAFSGVIHKRPSLLIVSAFPLGEKMVFSQSIVY